MKLIKLGLCFGLVVSGLFAGQSFADDNCPVGLVSGMTLDDEFGPGTSGITRCVTKRDGIKVVFQISEECKNDSCKAAYAIDNIKNAIKDYEITAGVKKQDYKIVAVVFGAGAPLVLNNDPDVASPIVNKFQQDMEDILALGVKVYFCQNTARKKGLKKIHLIPGVKFVTGGVTAITDFQLNGYAYMRP